MVLEIQSWDGFKQTCITNKNLNCQYEESATRYELYGPDGNDILWHVSVLKSDPRNSEQIDFEDNRKAAFNWAVGSRAYSFSAPDFMFDGDAILATCTKTTTTNVDFKVGTADGGFHYINGAVAFTDKAVMGDYASSSIIDKDNILGYGANTVLSSYIAKWYINPNMQLDIATPYAGKILNGLYIRTTYTSVGTVDDVKLAINYRFHLPL